MKLSSTRPLDEQRDVLKESSSSGPDPVYWVFSEISESDWANLTVIVSGDYQGECPKTYGHYHPEDAVNETYHLIDGEGVLLMQKKAIRDGQWIENQVDEVYLIKAVSGDEIIITPEFGHSWSNTGNKPLLSYDDWRSGHQPSDYEVIKRLHGMAYFLVHGENGRLNVVPNPNYPNLPEPKWVSAEEFRTLTNS